MHFQPWQMAVKRKWILLKTTVFIYIYIYIYNIINNSRRKDKGNQWHDGGCISYTKFYWFTYTTWPSVPACCIRYTTTRLWVVFVYLIQHGRSSQLKVIAFQYIYGRVCTVTRNLLTVVINSLTKDLTTLSV